MILEDKNADEFIAQANDILESIESELSVPEENRLSGVSTQFLQRMRERISSLIALVKSDQLPEKSKRYRALSRIVMDEWPFGTPIGNAISDLDEKYLRL